ncbi:LysR family transcriptional regulator [Niveibacterium sp. SC-1]|uniref:LysR family transcriptional regulator n=1 Tax=Niveibacterium sp. SC-1 TaxID=3135646 RepID=UPI00311FA75C
MATMADRRLQVFLAVAKHRSFTRAAEALYMTQPAVTFQIKQLEEHFNTRLLDRGYGKVTLTPAGEIVLEYAERILGISAEMEDEVAGLTQEPNGVVTVGLSPTIASCWLPSLLDAFKREYPKVVPRVFVGNSEWVERRVAEKELDVGLVEMISDEPTLECREVARDEMLAIVPPGHTLSRHVRVRPEDLVGLPFIDREPGAAIRELAETFFRAGGFPHENLDIACELGSLSTIKHLVRQGVGFAIAARASIERDVREGRLVSLPLEPNLFEIISVLLPKDKFRSRVVSTFADFATEHLKKKAQERRNA